MKSLKTFEDYIPSDPTYDQWSEEGSKKTPKYEVIDSINMYLNQIKEKDLNKADLETLNSLNQVLKDVSIKID
jgi:hypothetical protein